MIRAHTAVPRPLAAVSLTLVLLLAGCVASAPDDGRPTTEPPPLSTVTPSDPSPGISSPTATPPSLVTPTAEPSPIDSSTPSSTVIPYDPNSDYADATPQEIREYVAANDELLESSITDFEVLAAQTQDADVTAVLGRAREVASRYPTAEPLDDTAMRQLLNDQERTLADMADVANQAMGGG